MEYLKEKFAPILAAMEGATTTEMVIVAIFGAVLWFLPTVISIFRNPKNVGKIFLLNIPLGLTITPWFILLAWSINPKLPFSELKNKLKGRKKSNTTEEAEAH